VAFLARCLNETPRTPEHGAPLRLVAPGRACLDGVKWVERLEVLVQEALTTGATGLGGVSLEDTSSRRRAKNPT
jgi:DMSO/TMAO reductase YedYZ molybdopterin-dependent catalytic subunit